MNMDIEEISTVEEMDNSLEEHQADWLEYPLDCDAVISISHSGCASGAYMPAVTYLKALKTMDKYSIEIFDFIEDH